jgi:hypothetical protein
MLRHFAVIIMLLGLCWPVCAIEQRHGILVGVVLKLDAGAKTVAVEAADGTEHTFHFLKATAVHGGQARGAGATDVFHGLKEGSQVAVHYTAKGTEETAHEIDDIGLSSHAEV